MNFLHIFPLFLHIPLIFFCRKRQKKFHRDSNSAPPARERNALTAAPRKRSGTAVCTRLYTEVIIFPTFDHPDLAGGHIFWEVVGMKVAQKRKLHITGKLKLQKVQIKNFGANLNALFVQGPVRLRTGWRRRKVMFFRKTVLINVDQ